MLLLKQSTAVTVLIGPFLDDTSGKDAETALTISQADVRLSKNGGNMAQKNDSTAATHDELGYYSCPLDATDTGTLGRLKLMVHESGALPVWHEFMVVRANVYDSLVSDTDFLWTDTQQVDGDSTAAANLSLDYDGTGYNKSNSTIGTVSALTGHTAQTGDNYARLGAPAGASLSADVAAVKAKTDNIPASPAAVGSEMALEDGAITTAKIGADAITEAKIADGAITSDQMTNGSREAIAQIVWRDPLADHSGTAGSVAEAVDAIKDKTDNLPASPAAVGSEMTLQDGAITAAKIAADAITEAKIADDAIAAEHLASNAIGSDALAAGAITEIKNGIWDALLADHTTANTMGKQMGDVALTDELPSSPPSAAQIRAEIDSNSTQLAALVDDAVADSVPADGSLPTLKQAVYMITQFLMERSVSGTTVTVKKADGSTSLMTFTLDDGTSPTSITRAS